LEDSRLHGNDGKNTLAPLRKRYVAYCGQCARIRGLKMNSFNFIIGLALAGALGTLARYAVGIVSIAAFGTSYPYGTFLVNVVGSFLFGLLAGLPRLSAEWQIILLTGFLGGFTTFSAFAFENYQLLGQHRYLAFSVHVLGQNVLGIAAVLAGFVLAAWCVK